MQSVAGAEIHPARQAEVDLRQLDDLLAYGVQPRIEHRVRTTGGDDEADDVRQQAGA
ncbi:MAG TPA: hypothetical protein VGB74_17975 [Actinoplanes sp.]